MKCQDRISKFRQERSLNSNKNMSALPLIPDNFSHQWHFKNKSNPAVNRTIIRKRRDVIAALLTRLSLWSWVPRATEVFCISRPRAKVFPRTMSLLQPKSSGWLYRHVAQHNGIISTRHQSFLLLYSYHQHNYNNLYF